MLLSFAYPAFSTVLQLLVKDRRSQFAKDVELVVLRHQLPCSDGRSGGLRYDRLIARCLPRSRDLCHPAGATDWS
jgi:hypothetical protein